MPDGMRPGDVLAGRYRLTVLLHERAGGRFWRAFDQVLARDVAIHLIPQDDDRADALHVAAKCSATVHDPHLLRVLDADTVDGLCYVVNEWGEGVSLNNMVVEGPLSPRRAAWITAEVGQMVAAAHAAGLAHGRLVPENVLVDQTGAVKVIGFAVDAALHGLPPGRASVDVADLAGVLYTGLTGKWAGPSTSSVPQAPTENGHPLRPRRVRAGVPRQLDTLCDEVLGHAGSPHGYDSARAIVDALLEYVGDPAAVAAAEAELMAGLTQVRLPRQPEPPGTVAVALPHPAEPPAVDAATGEHSAAAQPGARGSSLEETRAADVLEPDATQAGVPVFEDEPDLAWLQKREDPPPPPPPFEEPPARPLFAPDPPPGQPVRTPRQPPPAGGSDFWRWEDTGAPAAPVEEPEERQPVPGRGWLRTAGIIAAILLVVIAMVYAFNRGRDGGGLLDVGDDPAEDTTSQELARIRVVEVQDFDPQGEDGENPESTQFATDGNPQTTWRTSTYFQQLGPQGLKEGVGLVLDLGEPQDVHRVTVGVVGGVTEAQLLGSAEPDPPADVEGLAVSARGTSQGGQLDLSPDEPLRARWLVVWLTELPQVGEGEFRGEVAEVVVRG